MSSQASLQGEGHLADQEGGRYDCREVYENMEMEASDGETADFRCGSWDCYCCGYRMRQNLVEEIARVCEERPAMRRLLTLTLDPATAPDSLEEKHAYLTERWNALRTELTDRYGSISYIWVREEGEEGHPHLHIIINRYLPQEWLARTWAELGGGEVVDIRRLDSVENAAHYVGKYLTKNAFSGLPDGSRRYGSSQDISLDVRGGGGDDDPREWDLMMDDYTIVKPDGEPLRRGVTSSDLAQQKEWGGPVPPDGGLGG